jgi:hypothetical protein
MNIKDINFQDALIDNQYDKNLFITSFESLIGSPLNDDEKILISSMLQEYNAKSKKVSFFDVYTYLNKSKVPYSKSILLKISNNSDIQSQLNINIEESKKDIRKFVAKFILIMSAILLTLAFAFGYIKLPFLSSKSSGGVLVVDIDLLAYSASSHVIDSAMSPQQSQKFANDYRDKLKVEIDNYLDDGYVILNKMNTYAYSQDQDITKDLLDSIGIPVIENDEYLSRYNSQQRYDVLRNYSSSNIENAATEAFNDQNQKFNTQAQQSLDSSQIMTGDNGQAIDLQ